VTELAADKTKRLPRYPLLPAGLIGRLAVGKRFQGRGLGGALIVDAKDESASNTYRHFGFRPLLSRPMSLFLPIAEAARRLKFE
jgi:hypothetical protein